MSVHLRLFVFIVTIALKITKVNYLELVLYLVIDKSSVKFIVP